jgi:hypothetical protein
MGTVTTTDGTETTAASPAVRCGPGRGTEPA